MESFTVVLFVFQFYPVCNFGLGTPGSQRVNELRGPGLIGWYQNCHLPVPRWTSCQWHRRFCRASLQEAAPSYAGSSSYRQTNLSPAEAWKVQWQCQSTDWRYVVQLSETCLEQTLTHPQDPTKPEWQNTAQPSIKIPLFRTWSCSEWTQYGWRSKKETSFQNQSLNNNIVVDSNGYSDKWCENLLLAVKLKRKREKNV